MPPSTSTTRSAAPASTTRLPPRSRPTSPRLALPSTSTVSPARSRRRTIAAPSTGSASPAGRLTSLTPTTTRRSCPASWSASARAGLRALPRTSRLSAPRPARHPTMPHVARSTRRSRPCSTRRARRRRSQHPLLFFIGRRLIALVFLCLGVSVMAFVLTHLVPGDPAVANLGDRASSDPIAVKLYREHFGLDKPLPVQYVVYLGHLLHGDLGESEQSRRAVRTDLAEYIPATAELAITAMALAILLGITLGVIAATQRNRLADQVIRVVSLGGMSTPQFWLALVALFVFFYKLSWVPGSGRLDAAVLPPPHLTGLFTIDALAAGQLDVFVNSVQHLILPACVLAAINMLLFSRFTPPAVLA